MSQQNLSVSWQQQLATWLECQHQCRQRTQDARLLVLVAAVVQAAVQAVAASAVVTAGVQAAAVVTVAATAAMPTAELADELAAELAAVPTAKIPETRPMLIHHHLQTMVTAAVLTAELAAELTAELAAVPAAKMPEAVPTIIYHLQSRWAAMKRGPPPPTPPPPPLTRTPPLPSPPSLQVSHRATLPQLWPVPSEYISRVKAVAARSWVMMMSLYHQHVQAPESARPWRSKAVSLIPVIIFALNVTGRHARWWRMMAPPATSN